MNMRYTVLKNNIFKSQEYSLVPLRKEDMLLIKKWRNDQIIILRQRKPLTDEDQINYYNQVVLPSFSQMKPNIILFSYLKKDECIGYGGLVHIDWDNRKAELSFLMNTERANN
ncbi:MAG: GNAT family N-acetyltransferase, partial [Candidatus Omnitrophica bacterium]|nr:GNAT family N-acetyltransferase [Candidatus Omnitrophota bacterium]